MRAHSLECLPHYARQTGCWVTSGQPAKEEKDGADSWKVEQGKLEYDTDGVEEWLAGLRGESVED